jgi:hypothetical protein
VGLAVTCAGYAVEDARMRLAARTHRTRRLAG